MYLHFTEANLWVGYHPLDGQTAKNIRIGRVHFSIRACRAFLGARLLRSSGPRCVSRESSTCLRRKAAISPPPLLAGHFISLSPSIRRSCLFVWRFLSFQVELYTELHPVGLKISWDLHLFTSVCLLLKLRSRNF